MVKPNCNLTKLEGITTQIAETMLEVFQELYHISMQIKMPNDIVYGKKKIGGILTQTKLSGELVKYMVVGIGVNTNQEKFVKEIENIATSIKREFHIEIDNEKVICEFCNKFEEKMKERIGEM